MQLIQIYGFSYRRIDFKTVWPRNGHAASLGVNEILYRYTFKIQNGKKCVSKYYLFKYYIKNSWEKISRSCLS